MAEVSTLGYALLGLVEQQPRSGYDLRKIFANTPMISFSDSPGSIYPALQRLEKQGLIRSRVEERNGLRRRRLFHLTASGLAELKRWQLQLVTRDDVIHRVDELMLRFAFMDQSLGPHASLRFVTGLEQQLAAYIPSLREHRQKYGGDMPLSGRLALESGIQGYEGLLAWARSAIKAYQNQIKVRRNI